MKTCLIILLFLFTYLPDYAQKKPVRAQSGDLYGFNDGYGDKANNLIPFIYEDAGYFTDYNKLAPVKIKGKWGFIDAEGKTVIPFKFDGPGYFMGNYAAIKIGEKWGLIDLKGEMNYCLRGKSLSKSPPIQ